MPRQQNQHHLVCTAISFLLLVIPSCFHIIFLPASKIHRESKTRLQKKCIIMLMMLLLLLLCWITVFNGLEVVHLFLCCNSRCGNPPLVGWLLLDRFVVLTHSLSDHAQARWVRGRARLWVRELSKSSSSSKGTVIDIVKFRINNNAVGPV